MKDAITFLLLGFFSAIVLLAVVGESFSKEKWQVFVDEKLACVVVKHKNGDEPYESEYCYKLIPVDLYIRETVKANEGNEVLCNYDK